ncbi:hypothetical protein PM082_004310 [Marasmius tenuissimus]|nr:hypothetical protein PM082_004310 [Marasmius tenuissimus]
MAARTTCPLYKPNTANRQLSPLSSLPRPLPAIFSLLNALPPAPLKPGSPIIALKGRDGVCRNGASQFCRQRRRPSCIFIAPIKH